jgi:hypothetical protein
MTTLTHEHTQRQIALCETLERFLDDGEFVIRRAPFRWMRRTRPGEQADFTRPPDGWSVISNTYEGHSAQGICEDRNWKMVHDFGHVAVVSGFRPAREDE